DGGRAGWIEPERGEVTRKRDQRKRITRDHRQLAELPDRNRVRELTALGVNLHAASAFDDPLLRGHRRDCQPNVESDARSDEGAHPLRRHRKSRSLNRNIVNAWWKVRDT